MMLALRRSVTHLRLGAPLRSPAALLLRPLSGQRKNEVVISETKHMAAIALKFYDQHDLEVQLDLLKKIRSDEDIDRAELVRTFTQTRTRLSASWLGKWICSATTNQNFKLFPLSAPLDNPNLSLGIRTELATSLLAMKTYSEKQQSTAITAESTETWQTEAMRLSNELCANICIDRLRKVGAIFQDFVDGQLPSTALYKELQDATGCYADELVPLLQFSGMKIPAAVERTIKLAEADRARMLVELTDELTHLVHVVNSGAFSIDAAAERAKAAETTGKTRRGRLRGTLTEPSNTYGVVIGSGRYAADDEPESVLKVSEKGSLFIRRGIDTRRKLRFLDFANQKSRRYIFDAKAPCYRTGRSLLPLMSALNTQTEDKRALEIDAQDGDGSEGDVMSESTEHRRAMPNYKIMIDNLPHNVDEDMLHKALSKCGDVEHVWIYRDDRASPTEVKNIRNLRLKAKNASGSFVDLRNVAGPFDLGEEGGADRKPSEGAKKAAAKHVATDKEALASGEGDEDEDSEFVSAKDRADYQASIQRKPTKQKLLRGVMRSDNYAFVLMKDEEGYRRATQQAVRLFGIQIEDRSCRVYPVFGFKSFMVEVGQELSVRETIVLINTLMKGHYECYATPEHEDYRPVFMHLQFENATDCWLAYDVLLRALDKINNDALVLTRLSDEPRLSRRISVQLSWIKTQWYKEWFFRSSKVDEELAYKEKEHKAAGLEAPTDAPAGASPGALPDAPVAAPGRPVAPRGPSPVDQQPAPGSVKPVGHELTGNSFPTRAAFAAAATNVDIGGSVRADVNQAAGRVDGATSENITAAMKEELRAALSEHASTEDTSKEAYGNAHEDVQDGLTAGRVSIEMPTEDELRAMGIDPTQLHTQTEQDKIINLITSQVMRKIDGGGRARMSGPPRVPRKARDSSFLSALALANKRRQKPTGRRKAATTASA